MGTKDRMVKEYFSDNRRYADLWNGGVFHGRRLVCAEELQGKDSVETVADTEKGAEQICDLIRKQVRGGQNLAVWVLESQETVDYSMPARVMFREAMEYHSQVRKIQKRNTQINRKLQKDAQETCRRTFAEEKPLKQKYFNDSGEFLYKFRKQDRLVPIATLVVYWGEEWSGAKTLHELVDFGEDNELAMELRRLVPEYPLHFLNLSELNDYECFETELRTLFELYACRNDKGRFKEYLDTHEECQHMDWETYHMLRVMTHSGELQAVRQDEEEEINVCKAIRDLIFDGKEEGKAEGKAEVVRMIRNMSAHEMSAEDIADLTSQPQEDIDNIIHLILQFPQKDDLEIAHILVEREAQQVEV